jgi:hypothetical protein
MVPVHITASVPTTILNRFLLKVFAGEKKEVESDCALDESIAAKIKAMISRYFFLNKCTVKDKKVFTPA